MRGEHLVGDPADRADLAVAVDGAGAGDELRVRQVAGGELVDDCQGEHQPADGPPTLARLNVILNGAHGASRTATPR